MFICKNIIDVGHYYRILFTWKGGHVYKGEPPTAIQYCFLVFALLFVVEFIQEYYPGIKFINHKNVAVRYSAYAGLLTLLLTIGVFNGSQFVYFQF